LRQIDVYIAAWFSVFNVITFLAFAFDKWNATCSKFRVLEFSLVALGLLGGWPGGFLGMVVFKHKSSKWTFKIKYALALIPFTAEVWFWIHWQPHQLFVAL
jgi:uncharacterized membrane protein YsdA (DUF1294 family)